MYSFCKALFRWLLLLTGAVLPFVEINLSARYWQLGDERLISLPAAQLPPGLEVILPEQSGDLDGDGQAECLEWGSGGLLITRCGLDVLWRSPEAWRVSEGLLADVNHDGLMEAVLLVWRDFQPWPVDRFLPHPGRIETHQNREGQSCQLILIGWKNGVYRELWAGSALAKPISNLRTADLDGDGLIELAVLETDYDASRAGGKLAVWRWLGFGFSLVDRTESCWERLVVVGDGFHHWIYSR